MAIKRNVNGVIDFLFDQLEAIDAREDMDLKDKIKLFDTVLKQVWGAARTNMEHKKLTLRAPDIAKSADVILDLGTSHKIENKMAATA